MAKTTKAKSVKSRPSRSSATASARRVVVNRPLYWDGIQEAIREGDLTKMKRVAKDAKELLKLQGDLAEAVRQLDAAIYERAGK